MYRLPDLLCAVVVTGCQSLPSCCTRHATCPTYIAHNADWKKGQSASLACGIKALLSLPEAACVQAALVLLGDMPLVQKDTLRLLAAVHQEALLHNNRHAATVPTFMGKRGNPVVLSRSLFPSLLTLSGDTGARALFPGMGDTLLLLPVDDEGILRDVDTPEEYAALTVVYDCERH
jgi:molybdenum cofactor cytidylyltransferase